MLLLLSDVLLYPFSNVCVYACMHRYVCRYVGIYVCMYVHIYIPMYICTYACIHGCMDTFLSDVCSCRRWVWSRCKTTQLAHSLIRRNEGSTLCHRKSRRDTYNRF